MSEALIQNQIESAEQTEVVRYPEARREDVYDEYHGIRVHDPYRWMEHDSPERDEWINSQRRLMEAIGPDEESVTMLTDRIRGYMPDVWDGIPVDYKGRKFFSRYVKGNNYDMLYELLPDGDERLIDNPNTWSEDGSIVPGGSSISRTGKYRTVAVSPNGTDRQIWTIVDLDTLQDLPDTLPETRSTGTSWLDDESGFFYTRINDDGGRSVHFHKLGTQKEQDEVLFMPEAGDKTWYTKALSHDDKYLYIYGYPNGGSVTIDAIDLQDPDQKMTRLVEADTKDTSTGVLHHFGEKHLLYTEIDSPKGRIVAKNLGEDGIEVIIPEANDTMSGCVFVDDRIVTTYSNGFKEYVKIFELDGTEVQTIQPKHEIGTVTFSSKDHDNPEAYVMFEGPVTAPETYEFNVRTGEMKFLRASKYEIDTSNFDVELRHAISKDGTEVPMFVCKSKDIELDGSNPTIMYGYGGFGSGMEPEFSPYIMPWLEHGGVYVTTCLRGGDELGREWHEAGQRLGKQRVFDDFIACAEELTSSGITSPDKLIIEGASNGGLLVAATMLQRPDLCRIAAPGCGLLDMLRYDKEEHAEAGVHWQAEYGTTDNEEEFMNLLSYSPIHNVRPDEYPTVYCTVGEEDDRVLPGHSYKFVAALQANQLGEAPIVADIEGKSGHGVSGAERYYKSVARAYGFYMNVLGMDVERTTVPEKHQTTMPGSRGRSSSPPASVIPSLGSNNQENKQW